MKTDFVFFIFQVRQFPSSRLIRIRRLKKERKTAWTQKIKRIISKGARFTTWFSFSLYLHFNFACVCVYLCAGFYLFLISFDCDHTWCELQFYSYHPLMISMTNNIFNVTLQIQSYDPIMFLILCGWVFLPSSFSLLFTYHNTHFHSNHSVPLVYRWAKLLCVSYWCVHFTLHAFNSVGGYGVGWL